MIKTSKNGDKKRVNANKKDIVEIVGIFALVASLVFVGMQLMLDRKVALAEQYSSRAESAKADRRSFLESQDFMQYLEESWALGDKPAYWDEDWEIARRVDEGTLSVRSVYAVILADELSILGFDSVYFQYRQGLLDEEQWNGLRFRLKRAMAGDELTRAIYERYARNTIRPVIEELLREIESEQVTTESAK